MTAGTSPYERVLRLLMHEAYCAGWYGRTPPQSAFLGTAEWEAYLIGQWAREHVEEGGTVIRIDARTWRHAGARLRVINNATVIVLNPKEG